jgi:hypothetical protein
MPALTLAQSRIDPAIWLYLGLLILLAIFGGLLIFALRAKLFSHDDLNASSTGGGLMEHLDSMLKAGEITKDEYDQTRRSIIDKAVKRQDQTRRDPPDNESDGASDTES